MSKLKFERIPCDACGGSPSALRKYRDGTAARLCQDCARARDYEKHKVQQGAYRKGQKLAQELGRYCQECGKKCGPHQLDTHHINPLSLGGTNDLDNLILLCEDCHSKIHYD